MTLYKWSQTASSDATADPTINWAEGQAPSSINDSARAMMAATAKYRDDIAGAIVTSGTAAAYAISSYESFDTLAHLNGQMIAFTPHITNSVGPVTLNVDSLGSKPLRSAPNVDLQAGTVIQGTPYVATYNNTDGAFYLQGFYGNPYNVPLGAGFDYWAPTAPNSCFAFPYGQAISRVTYGSLFALIGTTYGGGDGSSTFNLPDKRGRISVPLDTMGGSASGRLTASSGGIDGTLIGASGGGQAYTMQRSDLPNVAPTFTGTGATLVVSSTIANVVWGALVGVAGGGGGAAAPSTATGGSGQITSEGSYTPAGQIQSLNGAVTQTPMKVMPPAIVVPYLIRII